VRRRAAATAGAVAVAAALVPASAAWATVAQAPVKADAELTREAVPGAAGGYGSVRDAAPPAAPDAGPPVKATATQAGPLVTIADFAFRSPVTTVRVGQAVTWTNRGPSSHTATAANGSFDTGVLRRGASAGHRFTAAGTFAYVCSIHPFMKGTVRVTAAAGTQPGAVKPEPATTAPSTASPAPGAPASGTRTHNTATPATEARLPATGSDPFAVAVAGLAALAAGVAGLALARERR
jgi:LPXTG-motif cell wall-anchored protein